MAHSRIQSIAAALVALIIMSGPQGALAAAAEDYVEKARDHLASDEVKSAIIQLKNALQSDPSHVEARLMLGTQYLRTGESAAAAKEFGRARDLGAPADSWLPGYARALLLQGKFEAVLDEVQIDDDLPPEQRAELLALRGNAHLASRQVEAAVSDYDAALELQPGNPVARLGKARILLGQQQNEQALEQLNQLLLEHPEHLESLLSRGDLQRRLKNLDAAAGDYALAAQIAPRSARAHIGLALVHIAQRNVPAAKKDLQAINELAAELPAVSYLQALVSFQERDYGRASDELQKLLRVAPGNLQAQLLYGIVSYARGEFTIADDYLTRVHASMPANSEVAKILVPPDSNCASQTVP